MPGVQKPHWELRVEKAMLACVVECTQQVTIDTHGYPKHSAMRSWTGCGFLWVPRPSMVMTCLPSTEHKGVKQPLTFKCRICWVALSYEDTKTVQAPSLGFHKSKGECKCKGVHGFGPFSPQIQASDVKKGASTRNGRIRLVDREDSHASADVLNCLHE